MGQKLKIAGWISVGALAGAANPNLARLSGGLQSKEATAMLTLVDNRSGVQVAAAIAALAGAGLLSFTDKRWPEYQEPLIGTLFVLAATGGLLLLANNPHGGEHLKDLLVGQILWVSTQQLLIMAALTALVLALWFGLREQLGRAGFYLLFALAVTASVQLVGVYLVFTSLIVPALAVRSLRPALRLPVAYAIGALGYLLGLALSARFDLPSGAVVVLVMAVTAPVVPWVAVRWAKPSPPETTPDKGRMD